MWKSMTPKIQKRSTDAKAYNFTNVKEVISITNKEIIDDMLYIADDIFIPEKKNMARCYRSNFTLKSKDDVKKMVHKKKIVLPKKIKDADFFVYNEKTEQLLPFKKNDYLIYEHGYFTFDGKNYISYDDNGMEVWRF